MTTLPNRYTRKSCSRWCGSGCTSTSRNMPEEIEIRLLLDAIYLRYHYDFRSYSAASIKRRLNSAKLQMQANTFSELQEKVLGDPRVFTRLLQYLTVGVSDMFRDPSFFRALR